VFAVQKSLTGYQPDSSLCHLAIKRFKQDTQTRQAIYRYRVLAATKLPFIHRSIMPEKITLLASMLAKNALPFWNSPVGPLVFVSVSHLSLANVVARPEFRLRLLCNAAANFWARAWWSTCTHKGESCVLSRMHIDPRFLIWIARCPWQRLCPLWAA